MDKKQIKEYIKTLEVRRGYLSEMNLHALVAYNAAIESLHKQIPVQVIKNNQGIAFCASCNGSAWQNKDESKYCFRCGQRLDWK